MAEQVHTNPLRRWRRIALWATMLILATLAAINFRWLQYVAHLAQHQSAVIFCKERISDRLLNPQISSAERQALQWTQKIRGFVESRYGLSSSRSYRSFFELGRKELGYNITLAPALSLKAEAFHFFPIGKFEYLGFFDKQLADAWASRYRERGYDVHLSEIGGYSTLGWFEDPLYSSQLDWGEYGLARLLGHEIAHEKLYFAGDTSFSELLASFIERKVAADYLQAQGKKLPSAREQAQALTEMQNFYSLIDATKAKLERIYTSGKERETQLRQKQQIFGRLRQALASPQNRFEHVAAARELAKLAEINNATLIQFRRYAPHSPALQTVYDRCPQKSEDRYTCWFSELEKLRPCTAAEKKAWLGGTKVPAEACPR